MQQKDENGTSQMIVVEMLTPFYYILEPLDCNCSWRLSYCVSLVQTCGSAHPRNGGTFLWLLLMMTVWWITLLCSGNIGEVLASETWPILVIFHSCTKVWSWRYTHAHTQTHTHTHTQSHMHTHLNTCIPWSRTTGGDDQCWCLSLATGHTHICEPVHPCNITYVT